MFEVLLKPKAEKELDNLDNKLKIKIVKRLVDLKDSPYPADSKKLKDTNYYRIRIGDYRVIYEVNKNDKIIFVSRIVHRKDAYK